MAKRNPTLSDDGQVTEMVDFLSRKFNVRRLNWHWLCAVGFMVGSCLLVGCGTTRDKMATDQLLLSDAVDRSVANIDFSPLRNEMVYLDTQYIRQVKGSGFVNADYIISSLRQQMVLAGVLLQEDREQAMFIVEPRVGALGADGHDVNYGVPASQGLNAAASLVTATPPLPVLPEISLARKTDDSAAAKIAVFAYHRESRQPVWQSGMSVARSTAYGRWIFGAGPFQSGSIYDSTHFAGANILGSSPLTTLNPLTKRERTELSSDDNAYRSAAIWDEGIRNKLLSGEVRHLAALPEESTSKTVVKPTPPTEEGAPTEESAPTE
ncbi:MAG: hypothetical protein GY768_11640, partial [Planctomycetaceae bacterium]|nr:hypothetical protein [Planctomycetaceae bacterium]